MKRKLYKQIKFQWRSNVWLVIELVIISVVIWYIVDMMTQMVLPTLEPNGFDVENCYSLNVRRSGELKPGEKELTEAQENIEIVKRLRRYPGVEGVAVSNAVEPYCGNYSSGRWYDLDNDSLQYGGSYGHVSSRWGRANADFLRVFRIQGSRGETPDQLAEAFSKDPKNVIVSENFTQMVDSGVPAHSTYDIIGHHLGAWRDEYIIAGVTTKVKRQDSNPIDHYSLLLTYIDDTSEADMDWIGSLSIRVRPEDAKGFEERFREDMPRQFHVGKSYIVNIKSFKQIKAERMAEESKIKTKLYIVVGFLLLNVFLGLLGTFWYRTRQRISEVAVRLTFGASRRSIFRRFITEGIILLVIATVIAGGIDCMIAHLELNMREGTPHFVYGLMAWTIFVTFLLSLAMIFCGIYFPARSAMKIEPATALHNE